MHKVLGITLLAVLFSLSNISYAHIKWAADGNSPPRSGDDAVRCGEELNTPRIFESNSIVDLQYKIVIAHYNPIEIYLFDDDDLEYPLALDIPEPPQSIITTQSVTLPDIECDSCVLYIKQTSSFLYESCSDIKIVKQLDVTEPIAVNDLTITQVEQSLTLNWENPLEDVNQILVLQSQTPVTSELIDGEIYELDDQIGMDETNFANVVFAGKTHEFTLEDVEENTTYYFQVIVQDEGYNYSIASEISYTTSMNVVTPAIPVFEFQGNNFMTINDSVAHLNAILDESIELSEYSFEWSVEPEAEFNNPTVNSIIFNNPIGRGDYDVTLIVTHKVHSDINYQKTTYISVQEHPIDPDIETNFIGSIQWLYILMLSFVCVIRLVSFKILYKKH